MKKLVIERTYNAPIDEIWDALTDPAVLKQWWSPPGATCTYFEADVREGGRFRYCFTMDDSGAEFWGRCEYEQLEPPTYLSYYDSFTDPAGNDVPPSYYGMKEDSLTITKVEFELVEDGPMTHVTLTADNPFDEKMTRDMTDGWNGMFDKLITVFQ